MNNKDRMYYYCIHVQSSEEGFHQRLSRNRGGGVELYDGNDVTWNVSCKLYNYHLLDPCYLHLFTVLSRRGNAYLHLWQRCNSLYNQVKVHVYSNVCIGHNMEAGRWWPCVLLLNCPFDWVLLSLVFCDQDPVPCLSFPCPPLKRPSIVTKYKTNPIITVPTFIYVSELINMWILYTKNDLLLICSYFHLIIYHELF